MDTVISIFLLFLRFMTVVHVWFLISKSRLSNRIFIPHLHPSLKAKKKKNFPQMQASVSLKTKRNLNVLEQSFTVLSFPCCWIWKRWRPWTTAVSRHWREHTGSTFPSGLSVLISNKRHLKQLKTVFSDYFMCVFQYVKFLHFFVGISVQANIISRDRRVCGKS